MLISRPDRQRNCIEGSFYLNKALGLIDPEFMKASHSYSPFEQRQQTNSIPGLCNESYDGYHPVSHKGSAVLPVHNDYVGRLRLALSKLMELGSHCAAMLICYPAVSEVLISFRYFDQEIREWQEVVILLGHKTTMEAHRDQRTRSCGGNVDQSSVRRRGQSPRRRFRSTASTSCSMIAWSAVLFKVV